MNWLGVRITESHEVDLFGERFARTVEFRYVSHGNRWHLGRFGKVQYQENYAPYKNDNTWRTPAAQDWRPLITACESTDRVVHKNSSLVAVAGHDTARRLCDACRSELRRLATELLAKSPEYRRHQMLQNMLRHADDSTRQQLQTEAPDFVEPLLTGLRENGPEDSFKLACLAEAFGLLS